ncbi:hypothetical protein ACHAWT_002390 [Skeletonema menzelii]
MKYNNGLFYALAIAISALAAAGNATAAEESFSSSSPAAPSKDEAEEACSENNKDPTTCSSSQQQTSSSTTTTTTTSGDYYCVNTTINSEYEILTNQNCFHDIATQEAVGDFVSFHNLPPGQIAPILWRNKTNNTNVGGKIVSQYAFQITLPPNLIPTLLNYTSQLGIIDKFREFTSTSPMPTSPNEDSHHGQFVTFGSNRWYAQRPAKKFQSNMHWISPADERTQEEYLRVLFAGGFGEILDKIGKALLLDGLVAYHLTFLAVSKSIRGYTHHDTTSTGGRVYNVIIPLLLEEDVDPELILIDDVTGERGGYKYEVGVAALMGDDVVHGTMECDYTEERGGMRLAATVYIADINDLNVKEVADRTLTQIFPMADQDWLFAQIGRHWWNDDTVDKEVDQASDDDTTKSKKKKEWVDKGRTRFKFGDKLEDCNIRARQGMCESDEEETRRLCLKSCNIYIEDGPASTKKLSVEEAGEEAMYQVCTQNRTAVETCRNYQDDTDVDGDFVVPKTKLEAGEMFPIIWREHGSQTTPYAFQVGLPPELTTELLNYCDELGMTDLFREFVGENPIEALEDGQGPNGKFVTLADGNRWYAQRPEQKWASNMHWIGPADEKTHEEYIKVLAKGNLDAVLDGIGKYLGLDSLVAYHLTFMAVSHSEKGYLHRDTHDTGGSVYNIIIPLILDDEALPELEMSDWFDESEKGSLKYQIGTASMMGDDAMHGTQACDYREKKGMRMAATVYVADINQANYKQITSSTLTQIFPLPDEDWLWAQKGRHWGNGASLKTDKGRETFSVSDHFIDCEERADKGMCESDSSVIDQKATRKQCLKSCNVYEDNDGHEAWYVDKYDPEQEYEEWYYLTPFFDNRWDYSCVDSSDECEDGAMRGLCLTDPAHMKEIGCHRSCLFCFAADSRDLFSLGEAQVLESDDDDANEREVPDPTEVLEIIIKTEQYLVNKVFVATDYEHVRLSCRNFDEKCAIWAAQGYCDDDRGEMGKLCPAACQDCQMIDYKNRCPFDEETNVFDPGEMNEMFERILEECGEDTSAYSAENLPVGCIHPFGEVTVVSSPYDDMKAYLSEADTKNMDKFTPLPWMLLIDGFLSDEECDRLISFGNTTGYERSEEYSGDFDIDGSPTFTESDHRTSENTYCDDNCSNDPIVQGVLKRMEAVTGISMTNYEHLQLVRYEVGQYYHQHHDYSDTMTGTVAGHRILTFFMYLNDVEEGGGTKFEELNYIAQPKRGSALIWPSVTDEGVDILDEWTYHEALAVEKGIKFGANAWIHQRDYQNAPEYC